MRYTAAAAPATFFSPTSPGTPTSFLPLHHSQQAHVKHTPSSHSSHSSHSSLGTSGAPSTPSPPPSLSFLAQPLTRSPNASPSSSPPQPPRALRDRLPPELHLSLKTDAASLVPGAHEGLGLHIGVAPAPEVVKVMERKGALQPGKGLPKRRRTFRVVDVEEEVKRRRALRGEGRAEQPALEERVEERENEVVNCLQRLADDVYVAFADSAPAVDAFLNTTNDPRFTHVISVLPPSSSNTPDGTEQDGAHRLTLRLPASTDGLRTEQIVSGASFLRAVRTTHGAALITTPGLHPARALTVAAAFLALSHRHTHPPPTPAREDALSAADEDAEETRKVHGVLRVLEEDPAVVGFWKGVLVAPEDVRAVARAVGQLERGGRTGG